MRIFLAGVSCVGKTRPIQKDLTDHEKRLYLREIKRHIAYFNRSFRRADLSVDISGCSLDDASHRVWDVLNPAPSKDRSDASGQRTAMMHARA